MGRRASLDYQRFQKASANQNNLYEMVQGMQTIKLQGAESKMRAIWGSSRAELYTLTMKSQLLTQWQDSGATFFMFGKDILITVVAAQAVIHQQMTLEMMVATQYMVGQLNAPLQQFIQFVRAAQDAKISLERSGEILEQPDEDAHLEGRGVQSSFGTLFDEEQNDPLAGFSKNGAPGGRDICFENVSFRYSPLTPDAVKNFSLTIPNGKTTAIVGTSGSGKTTLINLALGAYHPSQGVVRVGDVSLQSLPAREWRKRCGAVMQDGFIFSDTILFNIALSGEKLDKKRFLRAVQLANVREFAEKLPQGYHTKIGAQGNGLSSGQRQRLMIARALYKDAPYIFFDEATNALDANNEREIVEGTRPYFKNRTVVIVAHRLSTVKNADQIVVMEKGEIVEVGKHQELVDRRGAYYELIKNQLELGE